MSHVIENDVRDSVLEAVEEGIIDRDHLIMACLKFMSDVEVISLLKLNEMEFVLEKEEEVDPYLLLDAERAGYEAGWEFHNGTGERMDNPYDTRKVEPTPAEAAFCEAWQRGWDEAGFDS